MISGGESTKVGEKAGHVSLCHEIWKEEWKQNTTQDLLVSEIWIDLNVCALTLIQCKAKAHTFMYFKSVFEVALLKITLRKLIFKHIQPFKSVYKLDLGIKTALCILRLHVFLEIKSKSSDVKFHIYYLTTWKLLAFYVLN